MKLRFLSCSLGVIVLALLSPSLLQAAEVFLPNTTVTPIADRISWSAILSGAVVALALHMALSTLGIGVGAAAIDAHDRKNPVKGVPTMLFVWMFVSGLIALFVGGIVSGRLAGTAPIDSSLHGVITWALATVVILVLAMTSVGYAVGGMFKILGESVSTVAKSAAAVVPNAAQMAGDLISDNAPSINWKSIKRDAEELFEDVSDDAKELVGAGAGERGRDHGKNGHKNRMKSSNDREDILEMVEKSYSVVRDGLDAKDRDGLKEAMTSRMGVSKEVADKTIEKWEKNYSEAKKQYQQLVNQAEQSARESAEVASTAVSRIAVWTFASLMCGMFISGLGGYLGSDYFRI